MMKEIKYVGKLTAKSGAVCQEQLPGCERVATVHVCFEDGNGGSVCRNCFEKKVNRGDWTCDSTEVLMAS